MSSSNAAAVQLTTSGVGLECTIRLPLPDKASAATLVEVLRTEAPVDGTEREVSVWAGDGAGCTVAVTLKGSEMRPMRSAVGAVLEQAKLSVRTMRVFPPVKK